MLKTKRQWLLLLLFLTPSSVLAFGPKQREPAFQSKQMGAAPPPSAKKQQHAIAAAAAAAYCSEESCYPPPFAVARAVAIEQQAASVKQQSDDEFAIGYGTGVIACVVSLAMGFALGYNS